MSDNLSLVYIINSLDIGGAEIGMCRLLDGLALDEYDVTVVALSGQSEELLDRLPPTVRIIDLSLTESPTLSSVHSFLTRIRDADVIVGSLFHSAMVARAAGLLQPAVTVATWQHNDLFEAAIRRQLFQRTACLSDVILADSAPVAEMLVDELGLDADRVATVPIAGIDLDEYTAVTHEPKEQLRVGTVGRLAEQKQLSAVLHVAGQLQESGFSFKIAGDGELYDELQREIDRRSLANVSVLGRVDDIPAFLSELDIYFQPSLWEGLCITVLEAMAAGLPVVGSDVGGIGRNVEHGESGYLYAPSDMEGFVSGLKMLAAEHERRARFGEAGQATVAESFTQDVLVREFQKAIGVR